ncbi:MAG: chemotaxis protein CheW [Bacteroidota bacterium]|nr:chemotaxis protein CheW [Bacteroidota bacterium]
MKEKITYLTFRLGNEFFSAPIDQAVNVLEMMPITEVPRSPEYMKGVVNVRGDVLPIVDTRMKFGMSPIEITRTSVIIIFKVDISGEMAEVGALVDEPGTVVELSSDELSEAPAIGAKYKSELIKGTFQHDDNFVMIVDVGKVFTLDELRDIQEVSESK